jgi:hypothetical protein
VIAVRRYVRSHSFPSPSLARNDPLTSDSDSLPFPRGLAPPRKDQECTQEVRSLSSPCSCSPYIELLARRAVQKILGSRTTTTMFSIAGLLAVCSGEGGVQICSLSSIGVVSCVPACLRLQVRVFTARWVILLAGERDVWGPRDGRSWSSRCDWSIRCPDSPDRHISSPRVGAIRGMCCCDGSAMHGIQEPV